MSVWKDNLKGSWKSWRNKVYSRSWSKSRKCL